MAITNYGDISQRTAAYAATEMLAHAEPILIPVQVRPVQALAQEQSGYR